MNQTACLDHLWMQTLFNNQYLREAKCLVELLIKLKKFLLVE